MAKITKNSFVEQIVTPIKGVVTGFSVDQETGDTLAIVEWEDPDGTRHSKTFKSEDLKLQEPQPGA